MPSILLQSRLKPAPEVLSREMDGETVILNPETGIYFGLDPIGTQIWHLIQEQKTLESVCESLAQDYAVKKSRCQKDVFKLASDLYKSGIVEISSKK